MKHIYIISMLIALATIFVSISGCTQIGPTNIKYNLYSLDRGSSISGSFVLGTGSIDTTPVYYCYIKDNGGYKLITINARNSIIYDDENNNPYVEASYYVRAPSNARMYEYIPENQNFGDTYFVMKNDGDDKLYSYTLTDPVSIHIPNNSVKRAFNP